MATHDYTERRWGHDFTIVEVVDGGKTLHMMGWGNGIKKGDFLVLPNADSTTRYKVKLVEYFNDPRDMWKIKAGFCPRKQLTASRQ